nr:immunoglobulin light chain junction region [Macaca mulatta]MOX55741.1 immunoglobulin light chain junction region [Macaca mulatta]
CHQHGASPLTF